MQQVLGIVSVGTMCIVSSFQLSGDFGSFRGLMYPARSSVILMRWSNVKEQVVKRAPILCALRPVFLGAH